MKVVKTNKEEISRLNSLLNEIEWLSNYFRSGYDFSDIYLEDYEILQELPNDDAEEFLKVLCHKIAGNHFKKVLFNCSTLLDNCADENQDTLDFNPKIKAGFEAIELLKEIDEYLSPNPKNHIYSQSILHEKIKGILLKVPVDTVIHEPKSIITYKSINDLNLTSGRFWSIYNDMKLYVDEQLSEFVKKKYSFLAEMSMEQYSAKYNELRLKFEIWFLQNLTVQKIKSYRNIGPKKAEEIVAALAKVGIIVQ